MDAVRRSGRSEDSFHRCRSRKGGTSKPFTRLVLLGAAVGLLAASVPVSAQTGPDWRGERGSVRVGALYIRPSTSTELSSPGGALGTTIDLERDLGLETSLTVADLNGYFWFGPHGRADFSVFRYDRSATRQIDKTIDFGDQQFPVNAAINTSSQVTIFKAAYTFAALDRERGFLGITAGLYTASPQLELKDTLTGADESNDATLPLPVAGLRGRYEFGRRIVLRGSAEWFGVSTSDAGGRLLDTMISADYRISDRVAIGIGYDVVTTNIHGTTDKGLKAEFDWGYDAATLYVQLDFGR
jgi:hypothetical protein